MWGFLEDGARLGPGNELADDRVGDAKGGEGYETDEGGEGCSVGAVGVQYEGGWGSCASHPARVLSK